ncbi:Sec-independent protein translocase subunit TatA/TatB [Rubrobacter taiwanensis]|uniref:Sec-independent protein translocase subunit TatA/TatB n=1 Tax=Rubrobacter taiwanensis TaxID=185139 RepID=UPI001A9D66A5|nr:twin-arginine translocase TatA/TatE family subunit [Rubrobacter taiwanensis]
MPFVGNIGGPELLILLVIILLLFGARRIPELARGLGSGVREFKKSSSGAYDESDEEKERRELNERQEVGSEEEERARTERNL